MARKGLEGLEASSADTAIMATASAPAIVRRGLELLDRATILAADDLRHVDVDVPEWGGVVRVRSLTGAERLDMENEGLAFRAAASAHASPPPGANGEDTATGAVEDAETLAAVSNVGWRSMLLMFTWSVVGADGARLFSAEDADALAAKSFEAFARVYDVAVKMNGAASVEEVEALAKN